MRNQHNNGMAVFLILPALLLAAGVHVCFASEEIPQASPAVQAAPAAAQVAGEDAIRAGETLTLARCIEIALRKNPAIVAAAHTVDANRSRVGEARAAYYP